MFLKSTACSRLFQETQNRRLLFGGEIGDDGAVTRHRECDFADGILVQDDFDLFGRELLPQPRVSGRSRTRSAREQPKRQTRRATNGGIGFCSWGELQCYDACTHRRRFSDRARALSGIRATVANPGKIRRVFCMQPRASGIDRRGFIRSASASALAAVMAWHAPGRTLAADVPSSGPKSAAAHDRFARLRLETAVLSQLRQFYGETLGLPLVSEHPEACAFQAGTSRMEFGRAASVASEGPFYHFAFNIPENKFADAKRWLAARVPLLKDIDSGKDEVFFPAWNAHAVYFKDPSGNIGELIARHTMANARTGEFTVDDLLCVSEIGLPSANPAALEASLASRHGLKRYLDSPMFMGDEHGLFILPTVGRPWIPERIQKASVHPVDAIIRGRFAARETLEGGLPYNVEGTG
jgi:hypothetical protein